jgi:hypothetical protein
MLSLVKIGGLLMSKQAARPGEVVVWKANANRLQGRRAPGGRLYLTNERLLFNPHFFDAMTGGRGWAVHLSEVTAIGREERDLRRLSRLRPVLRIETSAGEHELFVINRLDEVTARLRTAVEASPP